MNTKFSIEFFLFIFNLTYYYHKINFNIIRIIKVIYFKIHKPQIGDFYKK